MRESGPTRLIVFCGDYRWTLTVGPMMSGCLISCARHVAIGAPT